MPASAEPAPAARPTRGSSGLLQVLSQSGIYAVAGLAQQGVSFLLLPLYTRLVPQAQYGQLELLGSFSSIVFAVLMLGLASAITKCYHRDCRDDAERGAVLPTALLLDVPLLAGGGAVLMAAAGPIAGWLFGAAGAASAVGSGGPAEGAALVRLMAAGGVLSSCVVLWLAGLRAQERPAAFGVMSVAQLTTALTLTVLLVVHWHMGVRGILWGNLLSNLLVLLLGAALAARRRAAGRAEHRSVRAARLRLAGPASPASSGRLFERRLAAPLLRFGTMLLPALLASWVMDLSDRWVLRHYTGLAEVAVYAVGYKVGMVLQAAVVWPFQLAWPAISFRLSREEGHRQTYAEAVTWLAALMAAAIAALTLLARIGLPLVAGAAYREAWRIVPVVALAYACNGLYYAFSPGIHLAGHTRWLPPLALAAAALNLGLNFALIPAFGRAGAAWSTAAAFAFLALGTALLSRRVYPVPYEGSRLARIGMALALVLGAGRLLPTVATPLNLGAHVALALAGVPLLLLATGVLRRPRAGAAAEAAGS
jgi:O-antigen/teichoic acid export membrane protein